MGKIYGKKVNGRNESGGQCNTPGINSNIGQTDNNITNIANIKFISRYKNPFFWLGVVGVFFTAIGVSPESVTSWAIFKDDLIALLQNPYQIRNLLFGLAGVYVNPITYGFGDHLGGDNNG